MRNLVAVLHTILGALAGSTITLGIVSVFVIDPGSALASRLIAASLVLAGLSVVGTVAAAIIQSPRRTNRTHA